jgi:hypothetical protein
MIRSPGHKIVKFVTESLILIDEVSHNRFLQFLIKKG